MMLDLLFAALFLSSGVEQRTYLLHTSTPPSVQLHSDATERTFTVEDGAGGYRSVVTVWLGCNSSVTIDTLPIRRHCMYLPWIATGET